MRRHRFGEGEYRYFDAPLPAPSMQARRALYPPLAGAGEPLGGAARPATRYPVELDAFLERCHAAGQTRPTPLILRYGEGGHNTLHQDLYGDVAFPLQAVTVLNRPGADFDGRAVRPRRAAPRAQSRAHVIDLKRGAS